MARGFKRGTMSGRGGGKSGVAFDRAMTELNRGGGMNRLREVMEWDLLHEEHERNPRSRRWASASPFGVCEEAIEPELTRKQKKKLKEKARRLKNQTLKQV